MKVNWSNISPHLVNCWLLVFCVYCLHFVLSSDPSSKRCRLFPNISHLRLHLGSIYKLLHRAPLPSQFPSTSNPPVALLNYSITHPPPLFYSDESHVVSAHGLSTGWVNFIVSVRRCINVNHIRHKLIHLNGIETICVLKIALCTQANAERPVDKLWTTRTKCVL